MKIVILDGYTENPGDLSWEGFQRLGELTVYDRTPPKQVAERLAGAQCAILNKTPLDRAAIESCPELRYVGVLATGYNVVDVAAAKEHGIVVCNIPSYGTEAVGQFAIAMLLEICHHVAAHSESVHRGEWTRNPDWCYWNYPLIELKGKTMGIIGYGRIGQCTGRIAQALGMRILACDAQQNPALESETVRYASLDALFAASDVISLHCPLFESNRGMINRESIAKMKDGVILLNNARGPLVNEQDLADALNSGKVYAAGLDVVSTEPIQPDNPLLGAKNCFITPHISWAPKESRQRLMDIAVGNLERFLAGKPVNVVG